MANRHCEYSNVVLWWWQLGVFIQYQPIQFLISCGGACIQQTDGFQVKLVSFGDMIEMHTAHCSAARGWISFRSQHGGFSKHRHWWSTDESFTYQAP
jgi:hypothetical protein